MARVKLMITMLVIMLAAVLPGMGQIAAQESPRPLPSAQPSSETSELDIAMRQAANRMQSRAERTSSAAPAVQKISSKGLLKREHHEFGENGTREVDEKYLTDHIVNGPIVGDWMWPTPSRVISSPFGVRSDPFHSRISFHSGTDIAENCGVPVASTRAGTVTFAGTVRGYGLRVEVNHGGGFSSTYNHLSHIRVHAGQYVRQGEPIGKIGTTGRSTGCHLHFEILINGKFTDPLPFLNGGGSATSKAYDTNGIAYDSKPDSSPSDQPGNPANGQAPADPCAPLRDGSAQGSVTVNVNGEQLVYVLLDGQCVISGTSAQPTPGDPLPSEPPAPVDPPSPSEPPAPPAPPSPSQQAPDDLDTAQP